MIASRLLRPSLRPTASRSLPFLSSVARPLALSLSPGSRPSFSTRFSPARMASTTASSASAPMDVEGQAKVIDGNQIAK